MIDCGEGTQMALRKKGYSSNPIDVICFTHYHGDHISGLPGLLLTMGNAERKEPLTLIGPKGLERVVNALRVVAPELPFKIIFREFSESTQEFELNGYHIRAFRVNHNVTCYGYTVSIDRAGKFDAERAKAQEIPLKYWNRLQHGETVTDHDAVTDGDTVFTPDMVMGPDRKGLKVTYATDTRPTDSIRANAPGSDLLILEGMYGEKEKLDHVKEHKHMLMQEAAALAAETEPGELWLTHYSPANMHPADYAEELNTIFPRTTVPKDGQSTELNFEED